MSPRNRLRRLMLLVVTMTCLISLSGCGLLRTWDASQAKYDLNPTNPLVLTNQDEMVLLARRFGLMAVFSKAVYRDDLLQKDRNEHGCDYLLKRNEHTLVPDYGMPHGGSGRWERWTEVVEKNSPPCMNKGGLYYETYLHLDVDNKLDEAVIAFRGTENSLNQIIADWSTNFAAAFGVEPSEYKNARLAMPGLIEALTAKFEDRPVKIYATGHSLGGGLAQQLAYMSSKVHSAVTFNTTPVTNWSTLRIEGPLQNDYPTIYRLEHGGEFLSLPRAIATAFTSPRFGRYDYQIQIDKRSPFRGHAIGIFACRFAELVASTEAIAEHDYPPSFAKLILDHALSNQLNLSQQNLCVCEKDLIHRQPDVGKSLDAGKELASQSMRPMSSH